jgi:hypothetical protein
MTTAQLDTTWVRADQYTRQAEYGPANFDRRQVFALNYVYSLPKLAAGNALTHLITNGWQLSGVTLASTGSPFTPGFSISGAGSANITGNVTASGNTQENARLSTDPFNRPNSACFFAPKPGSLGLESGINSLFAPGMINFDMSLQKEFAVRERVRFQLRRVQRVQSPEFLSGRKCSGPEHHAELYELSQPRAREQGYAV